MSPVLFSLSIEPLAEAIRWNPQIHDLTDEKGNQHKIALFADDILLLLHYPLSLITVLMKCLHTCGSISGYKVNESKSEATMSSGSSFPQVLPLSLCGRIVAVKMNSTAKASTFISFLTHKGPHIYLHLMRQNHLQIQLAKKT